MEKLRLQQVVLVEGRYDAAKLSGIVDALILTTDGFAIYKDKEKQALLTFREYECTELFSKKFCPCRNFGAFQT